MQKIVILNSSDGAWVFQELAESLANILKIEIDNIPRDFNYVLNWNEANIKEIEHKMFIPWSGINIASDKRLLADIFLKHKIAIPETYLINTYEEVLKFIESYTEQWCLKYPIGCGASGHKIINNRLDIPQKWLKPYVVQKFIKLKKIQVFRLYCAGKILFGWNRRKFTSPDNSNPWVAHANGAVYEVLGQPPEEVKKLATLALKATHLYDSFGCVDLLQDNDGNWLVLEVGTDGIFNHVDRNIGNLDLEIEINQRIATAFWQRVTSKFR